VSRINFRCRENLGRSRIEQVIDAIEHAYELASRRRDKRIIVEIEERNVTFW
jgi:hypothetical protein